MTWHVPMMRWLVVGGIAAFVAIIVLWRMTLTAPPTPESIAREAPTQPTRSGDVPDLPAKPHSGVIEPPVVRIPGMPKVDGPSEPATPAAASPEAMRGAFRRQVVSIDPYVSECVARATNRGTKLTGKASFTVVMAFDRSKGRVGATEVAIEPINTTVQDVLLLNCLRDTGKKMQLAELPEGVTSILVTHEFSFDGGAIRDHTLSAMTMLPVGVSPP